MKKFISAILAVFLLVLAFPACSLANFEETIIVDNDILKAEITNYSYEQQSDEYVFEFYIENRSNTALEFGTDYACVNGYIVDSYMYGIVASGRRCISYLEIMADDVRSLELDDIDSLNFRFYANDGQYLADGSVPVCLYRGTATVFPTGKQESEIHSKAFSDFISEYEFSNEFINLVIYDAKPIEGTAFYEVCCAIENPCEKDITVSSADFIVDGIRTEPYWLCRIPAGMKILSGIFVDEDAFPETSFFAPDEISFTIMEYDGWLNLYGEDSDANPFFAYPIHFYPAKG